MSDRSASDGFGAPLDRVSREAERRAVEAMLADLDDDLDAGDITPAAHAEEAARLTSLLAALDLASISTDPAPGHQVPATADPDLEDIADDLYPASPGLTASDMEDATRPQVGTQSDGQVAGRATPAVTAPGETTDGGSAATVDPDRLAVGPDPGSAGDAVSQSAGRPAAPTPPPPPAPSRPAGRRRGALLVGAGVLFAVAASLAVVASSGEREDDAPLTGSVESTSQGRIATAQDLVSQGNIAGAVEIYFEVIDRNPRNPVALAQLGWLLRVQGIRLDDEARRAQAVDGGLRYIDRALAEEPGYAEARFFRGMILLQDRDDPAGAATEFRLALESGPPDDLVAFLADTLRRAEEAAAERAAAGSAPPPDAPPPVSEPPTSAP